MNPALETSLPRSRPGVQILRGAGWLTTAALAGWLLYGFVRVALYAAQSWGVAELLSDGIVLLRLAELLVIVTTAACLLVLPVSPEHRNSYLKKARWVIWSGALLAALAAVLMWQRITWGPFALAYTLFGAVIPFALGAQRKWLRRVGSWGLLVLLLLAHLVTLGLAFIVNGYIHTPYPAPLPPRTTDREERWRQDARYLGSELERMHINAYHTVAKDAFWQRLNALEANIPQLTDDQIAIEMMGIVASVGDAHTSLDLGRGASLHGYPLNLRWYSDGLFITGGAPQYKQAVGARVIKIGALTSEDAYEKALPLVSHENDAWAHLQAANILHISEVLHAIGAIDQPGPVVFTMQESSGKTFEVEFALVEPGQTFQYVNAVQTPAFYRSRKESFWMEYRESSRTLYFRYAHCEDPSGFAAFSKDLWKLVDEKPVDRLIIDFRGNGGGNSLQFDRFFLPGLEKHPALNAPDRLYVLIDSGTFSAAMENAITMRLQTKATLVGQPTGGRPNSYGEVRYFNLPNSRMSVFYSTKYFPSMPGSDTPSLMPDIHVDVTAVDAFNGKDPVLKKIVPQETW